MVPCHQAYHLKCTCKHQEHVLEVLCSNTRRLRADGAEGRAASAGYCQPRAEPMDLLPLKNYLSWLMEGARSRSKGVNYKKSPFSQMMSLVVEVAAFLHRLAAKGDLSTLTRALADQLPLDTLKDQIPSKDKNAKRAFQVFQGPKGDGPKHEENPLDKDDIRVLIVQLAARVVIEDLKRENFLTAKECLQSISSLEPMLQAGAARAASIADVSILIQIASSDVPEVLGTSRCGKNRRKSAPRDVQRWKMGKEVPGMQWEGNWPDFWEGNVDFMTPMLQVRHLRQPPSCCLLVAYCIPFLLT